MQTMHGCIGSAIHRRRTSVMHRNVETAQKSMSLYMRAARRGRGAARGARLVMVADRMFGFGGNSDAATAVIYQLKLHFVPLMTY